MSTNVIRHGKASNAYLATLREPTENDFNKLVEVCISAMISEEIDVTIAFSYLIKFPKGFPRGICISKNNDGSNVYKVKAKRLLTWLNEHEYTYATVEMIGVQKRAFTDIEKQLENF